MEQLNIEVDDGLEETEIEIPTSFVKNLKIWSNNETKKLFSLYKTLIPEVGDRFRYQKDMWAEIASHFPGKTPQQCESRLTTVLRRRKRNLKKIYVFGGAESSNDSNAKDDSRNALRIIRLNKMQQDIDDDLTLGKNMHLWSNRDTKLLVELYKSLIHDVGSSKRFKQKKEMWKEISTYFPNKDHKQCESRLLRLVNKKKQGIGKYLKPNISEDEEENIDKANDSVEHPLEFNSVFTIKTEMDDTEMEELHPQEKNEFQTEEEFNPQEENEFQTQETEKLVAPVEQFTNVHEKREKTIQEVLLEISAKKEEAKERRHREKLEIIKQTQNILQQILEGISK